MKNLIQKWNNISLIKRIICGLIIGITLGLIFPQATAISILGDLFVGALRGIAPLLVFFLIMSSLCRMAKGQKTNMSFIVILYLLGNLFSALSGGLKNGSSETVFSRAAADSCLWERSGALPESVCGNRGYPL